MALACVCLVATVAWATVLTGCDGSFRFDQESTDGGVDVALAVDVGVDRCADGPYGWQPTRCDAAPCPLVCPKTMTCSGTCETSCAAHCEEGSRCTLATGDGDTLVCERSATCDAWLGRNALVDCAPSASCNVRCIGQCTVRCQTGALCQLQCGSSAARAVTGAATCP
jgi:hypothetical protein